MATKKPQVTESFISKTVAQFHMPGDKVLWRGIKLTVVRVKENGDIEAHSPTMFVTVSSHDQLTPFREVL